MQGPVADIFDTIHLMAKQGVPNYFGSQRYGHNHMNVTYAQEMLSGGRVVRDRKKKGIYLSAARSYLFDKVLAERVRQGNWSQAVDGDCMMLDGTHSIFTIDARDATIDRRIAEFDIHPTGPLWGAGERKVSMQAQAIEDQALAESNELMRGLEQIRVKMARRELRLKPVDLSYDQPEAGMLKFNFILPAGQYATTLLRELAMLEDASRLKQDD